MKHVTSPDQPLPDSAVPSGPASWRRAQQYKQDRPYQQDFRPNYSVGRSGPPMNQFHRNSPRQPFPTTSPAVSPRDPATASATFHRTTIPTGPRGFVRPHDVPVKKEYISPVPELDEQVHPSLVFILTLQRKKLKSDHEKLEAKDLEIQKRKRAALAEWTLLERESKREGAKVEMTEKLLDATVSGTLFVS